MRSSVSPAGFQFWAFVWGINAHGVIIDELHAQPNRELVHVLTTSTGARRQPLIIYITTADFRPREHLQRALRLGLQGA